MATSGGGTLFRVARQRLAQMATSVGSSKLPQPNHHRELVYTPVHHDDGTLKVNVPLLRDVVRKVVREAIQALAPFLCPRDNDCSMHHTYSWVI